MTLAMHDDELTVNVMPFGDDKDASISAICLTGTPAELDEGFAQAIAVKVQGRKSLAEQIEALKVAEKELADAKKAEADAKKAETAKKTKAAEAKKKEEEKKQDEAKEAEKAKNQEALF
jgi:PRTRC genetic system protein E